ncbi:MAG: BatD family protein [Candidatus Sericytochromatia bacterium]|nr:BatD family protein [Candidatus Sericytochromatia bacterium]
MDPTRRRQRRFLIQGLNALILALVLVLVALPASAKVLLKTTLSPNPAQVGEQVHLRIDRIEDMSATQTTLQTPNPEFPIIPGLSLLSSQVGQNISTQNNQVRVLLRYHFILVATQTGNFPIPPLSMGYDQDKVLLSDELTLKVQSPPDQGGGNWFWVLLFGILPVFAVGLWLLRRKSSPKVKTQDKQGQNQAQKDEPLERVTITVETSPPAASAMKANAILPVPDSLEALRNAFRIELGQHYANLPSGLTSQEIVNWLKAQGVAEALLDELEIYLHHCDHLRFQPQGADGDELALLHQQAERILTQLKP